MAALQNSVSILCKPGNSAASAKVCAVVERQLSVMRRLLDDLFHATEVGVGKVRLQIEAVVVQDALETAVSGVRSIVDQKGQELMLTLPCVPFSVEADPSRLQQMLHNLLGNASKFTPRGGHINISATVENARVVIRVQDDGMGISPEVLPHIFDLFTREETPEPTEGLGVGLAVVKELATLHGGGVEVRSPGTGKGSIFILRLPLQQGAPQGIEITP